ncbi:MAG: DUF2202 domain-containing protein [Phycisphaerales bacterium]|nr:DUF2202 domain-containing protein [Phycisphaerales bacterium]
MKATSMRSRHAVMLTLATGVSMSCSSQNASSTALSESADAQRVAMLDEPTQRALLAALDDERRAEALYAEIISSMGEIRPFVNIVQAERRHQMLLTPLLEKYGVQAPANPYGSFEFEVPATRSEACVLAARSERENIALYDRLLPTIEQQDVRDAFERLRWASAEHHLPAFERCAGS